ncbi:DNA -binding domain-containing protein [Bradyrhizobium sp. ORS 86]|uniref:DNA -binding domain-containing protein n=1 Tax=Bradyrhizobium sp. ORS 86 TaxID=1685970 RepID=UPI00388EFB55
MTTAPAVDRKSANQPLLDFAAGQVCRAADGWHAVLHIGSAEHRIWSKQPLTAAAHYAAELPLDRDFEARAHAATRLWRAMNGRAPGSPFHRLSKQRRERLCAALRAVAAYFAGESFENATLT